MTNTESASAAEQAAAPSRSSRISIARALKELKTLDGRIRGSINGSGRVVTAAIKGKDRHDLDLGSCDRIESLMERRNAIKAAVSVSNAKCTVEVGEQRRQYVVAEAIDRQRSAKEYDRLYLNALKRQLAEAQQVVSSEEAARDQRLDNHLQSLCGRDSTRTRADDVEAITEVFMRQNTIQLVNPLNLGEKIAKMESEIEDFEQNIDVCLSEHNAMTFIEILL
eukprot:TRINITY_DN6022_c0_g1_i2.p1 TRINITY_DN6022_c0_g1~~TRINITY_DN6022_c0_g1_i2.p1  ORF type:complete len:223 (-),score=74.40 TRINITY_DN6022_c0_g1_i2:137-805(-)